MTTLQFFTKTAWRIAASSAFTLSAFAFAGVLAFAGLSDKSEAGPAPIILASKAKAQSSGAPDPKLGAQIDDIWKPAPTPAGGTSWALLEAAKEVTRTDDAGFTVSYPLFTKQQRALEGKRIKVSGWMDPLQVGTEQKRFVLLGYPPGCPFHFHAAPMQFIEVMASTPFETDRTNVITVSGVLELTGYDESGVFYRLWDSRPA